MTAKKALERHFLEEVATLYPDFPRGTVTDTERPDFLISGDSHVTGIELVGYVRGQGTEGSDHLRNEVLWQQVAEAARRKFESKHSDPLMVHFSWHSNRYLRKMDVPLIATRVSETIEQNIPRNIFERDRISGESLDSLASTFIDSVHVTRVRNQRQVIWASITASFISVSAQELRSILWSKGSKAREYLRKCDEVWLIIVADGSRMSTTGDLSEEEARRWAQTHTPFERILFYDRSNGLITSLAN